MGRFAAAAKQRTNITLAKHNAECRVRECEAQLRMRRGELQDVVVGLQSIDRAIEDLWESVLDPTKVPDNMINSDSSSTRSALTTSTKA